MTRWIFTVRAVAPGSDGSVEVGVSEKHFRLLQQNGDHLAIGRLRLAKEVLEDPICIVQGWDRQRTEECRIYVGRPKRDYRSSKIDIPAPPGMLFLVFVLPGGTIDVWTWRPCEPDNPDFPQGVKGEVIWPQPTPT